MAIEQVRWGVLGVARIAENWVIPAIQAAESARLYAVASRSQSKAEAAAARFGAEKAYGSYEALLSDPDVEAVYIPLPNHMHKEWSIAAVQAGKDVLCEKPIALNAEEAREMEAAAKANGRLLLEAFMYRFGPVTQRAIELLRQGRIGELHQVHTSFSFVMADDPANIRLQKEAGGGALYDVGCYCINAARMLAGREPRTASARLVWSDRYGVDMGGAAWLDFGDGLLGTIMPGFRSAGGTFFRVVGSQGVLEAPDGFLGRGEKARLWITVGGNTEEEVITLVDTYRLEVEDASLAIRGVQPPKFGAEPLDANMRVIDACFASDLANGRPVAI
ncbi:MAG: Gfo/Idh/MocA family oxidoreductase [Chloroflexi bacterium]|nr:Gfo/Idh/MocA family oxidoreductase [Chloroflexota bacterium]